MYKALLDINFLRGMTHTFLGKKSLFGFRRLTVSAIYCFHHLAKFSLVLFAKPGDELEYRIYGQCVKLRLSSNPFVDQSS